MKARTLQFTLLIAFTVVLPSCRNDEPMNIPGESNVTAIEQILNGTDQHLINLLNKVRGSVGRRGSASKTIWSRKNEYGLGLYVSANHVIGLSTWPSRNAQFLDLTSTNPGIFETSQLPPADGVVTLGKTLIADFPLLHFGFSPNATNTTILPSEDVYLGVIDNQRVEQGSFPAYPDVVQTDAPLQLYDPANRTRANQTWNAPIAGENAIAIGYPQDKVNYPNGGMAYGKIVSDAEAQEIVLQLKDAGDAEGDIPYAADVEFFVNAQAIAGMSGGGVFNSEGQLLGIMVRASDKPKAPKIIRVVKMAYIRSKLIKFFTGLTETQKNKVRPFFSGEL